MSDEVQYKWTKISNDGENLVIQFEDGSTAQGQAALFITQKSKEETVNINRVVAELNAYNQQIQSYFENITIFSEDDPKWEILFDLIFSNVTSKQIFKLFESINIKFDYYDPDSSYYADVIAFTNAFDQKMKELNLLVLEKEST